MRALEAKVVVLGSQGVGKSSLIERYISKLSTKNKDIPPTIGATFFVSKIILDDVKIKMQVWDTAGQERFRAMAPMFYRNSSAALLVFDISIYQTFTDVKTWIQELQKNVQEPMVLVVVGNKTDLDKKRNVSRDEAFLFTTSIGGSYFETSTIIDQGIEQVFTGVALGLARLYNNQACFSIRRYESVESISKFYEPVSPSDNGSVFLSEAIDAAHIEATGIGRLETPSWSIDHIAHGHEQRSGWCCY